MPTRVFHTFWRLAAFCGAMSKLLTIMTLCQTFIFKKLNGYFYVEKFVSYISLALGSGDNITNQIRIGYSSVSKRFTILTLKFSCSSSDFTSSVVMSLGIPFRLILRYVLRGASKCKI